MNNRGIIKTVCAILLAALILPAVMLPSVAYADVHSEDLLPEAGLDVQTVKAQESEREAEEMTEASALPALQAVTEALPRLGADPALTLLEKIQAAPADGSETVIELEADESLTDQIVIRAGQKIVLRGAHKLSISYGPSHYGICDNQTGFAGGAVTVCKPATFHMKGGEIANNSAGRYLSQPGYGGGVCVATISGTSTSDGDEGGSFIMDGGKIIGNKAIGGQYDYWNGYARGGVGGGIWFCPSGNGGIFGSSGAVFDNHAVAREDRKAAGDDFVGGSNSRSSFFLTDNMIGGGTVEKWMVDGGVDGYALTSASYYSPENKRYDESLPKELSTDEVQHMYYEDYLDANLRVSNIDRFSGGYGLKVIASDADKQAAKDAAKLIITGNTATRGGGIGSNGDVNVGPPEERDEIKQPYAIRKIWEGFTDEEIEAFARVYVNLTIGEDLYYICLTPSNHEDNWYWKSFKEYPKGTPVHIEEVSITYANYEKYAAQVKELMDSVADTDTDTAASADAGRHTARQHNHTAAFI